MKHEQNILVALRVRPLNRQELRMGAKPIVRTVDRNLVVLLDPNRDSNDILRAKRSSEHRYTFDVSFGARSSQEEVYGHTSQGLVNKVLSGYNATVFAYGATGAGKTYTMLGRNGEPGVMMLTLDDLFASMEAREESKFTVSMAYLEIYNETIRDLLLPSSDLLDLREDATGATVVHGLSEISVTTSQEVMTLLTRGNQRRTCEPTAANKTSSRSHAVLKVTVEQQSCTMTIHQKVKTGVLFMVDLAGSERAANTKNHGLRMKEGAHINRSLLALANCINTLCSQGGGGGGGAYVNYRDSKLTRLLKDALSGNCQTVMIAHISPASNRFEESKNTLKYADRAKHLKTKVAANISDVTRHVAQYVAIIASLHSRINELEREKREGWKQGERGGRRGGGRRRGGDGEKLLQDLKTLLQEEKEIKHEMVCIEYHLLRNAVDTQRHLHTLRKWEEGEPSNIPSSSSLPPSSSSLPPCSPMPTTHECTTDVSSYGITSLQMTSSLMTSSLMLTSPLIPNLSSSESNPSTRSKPTGNRSHDGQMTTVNEATISHDSHMTKINASCDSHQSTSRESALPLSPEPAMVSAAREEVAVLVGDRQRMKARHRRLSRRLLELRATHSELKEKLSESSLLSVQKELWEVLQTCREAEELGQESQLAAAMAAVQLKRREVTLDGMVEVGGRLVATLEQCQTFMGGSETPPSLPLLEQYRSQLRALMQQARAERQLPVIGRTLQLPTIARLSARVYSNMTGSKSNLFVDDTTTDGEEEKEEERKEASLPPLNISDLHLSSLSTSRPPSPSHPSLVPSSLSLPPIPNTTSLVTRPVSLQPAAHNKDTLFPNLSLPAVLPNTLQDETTPYLNLPPLPSSNLQPPVSRTYPYVEEESNAAGQPHTDSNKDNNWRLSDTQTPSHSQTPNNTHTGTSDAHTTSNMCNTTNIHTTSDAYKTSTARTHTSTHTSGDVSTSTDAPTEGTHHSAGDSCDPRSGVPTRSSKRTSARVLLSKVGFNAPRISVSRCSSNRSKYVVHPSVLEQLQADGLDFINDDLLTLYATKNVHTAGGLSPVSHTPKPRGGGGAGRKNINQSQSFKRTAYKSSVRPEEEGKMEVEEKRRKRREASRKLGISSSQLRSEKNPIFRGQRSGRDVGERKGWTSVGNNAISSISNLTQVQQGGGGGRRGGRERNSALTTTLSSKPPPPLPVLTKKKIPQRRPLMVSKAVTAGGSTCTVGINSPYLSSTGPQKPGGKTVSVRKTPVNNTTHKPKRSPYAHSLAQTSRTKKFY